MNKRGQQTMGMPISMIFSIFLIIAFIATAIYVGTILLGTGKQVSIGLFYEDLQEKINTLREAQEAETTFNIQLPENIELVCFANLTETPTANEDVWKEIIRYEFYNSNIFLYPPQEAEEQPHNNIQHLDTTEILQKENPYCIDANEELQLRKGFYDKNVKII